MTEKETCEFIAHIPVGLTRAYFFYFLISKLLNTLTPQTQTIFFYKILNTLTYI